MGNSTAGRTMNSLILKTTASHYGGTDWGDNDFVVLNDGQVIGRIMLHPQAPKRQPWFWTITAKEAPLSRHVQCKTPCPLYPQ